jgi:hypothetical protein
MFVPTAGNSFEIGWGSSSAFNRYLLINGTGDHFLYKNTTDTQAVVQIDSNSGTAGTLRLGAGGSTPPNVVLNSSNLLQLWKAGADTQPMLTLDSGGGIQGVLRLGPGGAVAPNFLLSWSNTGSGLVQNRFVMTCEPLATITALPTTAGTFGCCSNCNPGTNPCTSGGSGAAYMRNSAGWVCL